MNKKGIGEVLLLFFIIIGLLVVAFAVALLTGLANNFMDELTPVINDLGVVSGNGQPGDNMTTDANYIMTPMGTIVNSLGWVTGVSYVLSLVLVIVLAVSFRLTGQKYLIVLFLLLAVVAIMISIMMSNTYQDFYDGTDSLATELHAQILTSWLILYSPLITTVIMFIAGIIMFTGAGPEVYA